MYTKFNRLKFRYPLLFRKQIPDCDYPIVWNEIVDELCHDIELFLWGQQKKYDREFLPYCTEIRSMEGKLNFEMSAYPHEEVQDTIENMILSASCETEPNRLWWQLRNDTLKNKNKHIF